MARNISPVAVALECIAYKNENSCDALITSSQKNVVKNVGTLMKKYFRKRLEMESSSLSWQASVNEIIFHDKINMPKSQAAIVIVLSKVDFQDIEQSHSMMHLMH